MTVLEALLKDGYTKREAEKQIKNGAWLYEIDDYISYIRDNGIPEDEISELKQKIDIALKSVSGDIEDGVCIVYDGKIPMILEKSL